MLREKQPDMEVMHLAISLTHASASITAPDIEDSTREKADRIARWIGELQRPYRCPSKGQLNQLRIAMNGVADQRRHCG